MHARTHTHMHTHIRTHTHTHTLNYTILHYTTLPGGNLRGVGRGTGFIPKALRTGKV